MIVIATEISFWVRRNWVPVGAWHWRANICHQELANTPAFLAFCQDTSNQPCQESY